MSQFIRFLAPHQKDEARRERGRGGYGLVESGGGSGGSRGGCKNLPLLDLRWALFHFLFFFTACVDAISRFIPALP